MATSNGTYVAAGCGCLAVVLAVMLAGGGSLKDLPLGPGPALWKGVPA